MATRHYDVRALWNEQVMSGWRNAWAAGRDGWVQRVRPMQGSLTLAPSTRPIPPHSMLDLDLANRVQRCFLPQEIPHVPGLQIYAQSRPASQIGGDYYDFIQNGEGETVFAVGDVSGKGVSAALFIPVIHKIMRSGARATAALTPSGLVDYASADLYTELALAGMFATVFTAAYNPLKQCVRYANAGHSPIIFRTANGKARLLEADGTPLGIRKVSGCVDRELTLAPGDLLVMATDGFSEVRNTSGEMFGHDRLLNLVDRIGRHPVSKIGQILFRAIAHFQGTRWQEDDQTLIVMKVVA